MITFNASVSQHFASFKGADGTYAFVESFDLQQFELRVGTLISSGTWGVLSASTDEELNKKLAELYAKGEPEPAPPLVRHVYMV